MKIDPDSIKTLEMHAIATNIDFKKVQSAQKFGVTANNIDSSQFSEAEQTFITEGWKLQYFFQFRNNAVSDGDPFDPNYACSSAIMAHHEKKQVIISHQVSNIRLEWLEDLRFLLLNKPYSFIPYLEKILEAPKLNEYRAQGYSITTTGDKLGAIAAQLCAYLYYRKNHANPGFEHLNAIVFDSPGMADYFSLLPSNEINPNALAVKNYCHQPSFVNTFGRHAGLVYNLADTFSFDHLSHSGAAVDKLIESGVIQAKDITLQLDWPAADYSKVHEPVSAYLLQQRMGKMKKIFECLSSLYSMMKQEFPATNASDTWFEEIYFHFVHSENDLSGLGGKILLKVNEHYQKHSISKPLPDFNQETVDPDGKRHAVMSVGSVAGLMLPKAAHPSAIAFALQLTHSWNERARAESKSSTATASTAPKETKPAKVEEATSATTSTNSSTSFSPQFFNSGNGDCNINIHIGSAVAYNGGLAINIQSQRK